MGDFLKNFRRHQREAIQDNSNNRCKAYYKVECILTQVVECHWTAMVIREVAVLNNLLHLYDQHSNKIKCKPVKCTFYLFNLDITRSIALHLFLSFVCIRHKSHESIHFFLHFSTLYISPFFDDFGAFLHVYTLN